MATCADGIAADMQEIAERARTLARLELELASFELRRKTAALGGGVALLAAGAVLGPFAVGFLLATAAAGLATALPTWHALLVVGGSLVLAAAVVALPGAALLRRGTPPVPEQALEARLTGEA